MQYLIFLSFGALRLSNGPLKLEMSHWNKIEGAIWHIEKKVFPIPDIVMKHSLPDFEFDLLPGTEAIQD